MYRVVPLSFLTPISQATGVLVFDFMRAPRPPPPALVLASQSNRERGPRAQAQGSAAGAGRRNYGCLNGWSMGNAATSGKDQAMFFRDVFGPITAVPHRARRRPI
jgi:hypothetical protein